MFKLNENKNFITQKTIFKKAVMTSSLILVCLVTSCADSGKISDNRTSSESAVSDSDYSDSGLSDCSEPSEEPDTKLYADVSLTSDNTDTSESAEVADDVADSSSTAYDTINNTSLETLNDEDVPSATINPDGIRDNTPVCYTPEASGTVVYSNPLVLIDASNASQGYVMVCYTGSNPKVKLQITGSNAVTYTYNLHGGYETFPLSAGDGSYKLAVYENVTGNQYAAAMSQTIDVAMTNPFGPYLYPNQYVNFNSKSKVVSKAMQLAENCTSDLDVITKIYNYTTTITYDNSKASVVQSGYTSNVDEIMLSGTGICLDYAAVMASMLRSQNIPTRLEVGYAGTAYHAWISTYVTDIGWINGMIQFDGNSWSLMDPTFAANSSESALKNFIGDGSNYKTKYIY